MQPVLHAPRVRKRSLAAAVLGALALVGSLLVAAPPAQALNDTGTGGVFVPATGRILDTQAGTGGYNTPMPAGTYRTIKVAGLFGLPDDGSVGAVSLNATVGASSGAGTLFGRPDADTGRTTMLIYSGVKGEFTSNTATLAVGADGTIQVMAETNARLILDVQGYYTANTDGTAAGGFVPVAKRIVDTRSGLGAAKATIAPGKSIDVQITGANGIPAGASGVVVNLIAINTTDSDGYLTPYATGSTKPQNALHYAPSVTTSMQAQVPVSSGGKITIANGSSTANLVIDLQGYFTAAGTNGAVFTPSYGRAYDSRASGNTALAKSETRLIQIAGQAGVPIMGSGITAVTLTLIVSHAGSAGCAQVYADGTSNPGTTAINFQADDIRTNTITVPLGANGKIALRNVADASNYIVDVQGWYTNPQAPTITCPSPYAAGSWATTVPSADITCTVITPAESSSNQQLTVNLDGDLDSLNDLSETASTSTSVTVPAQGGAHTIAVEVDDARGTTIATNAYSFGLGDWFSKTLTPTPADGAEADTAGSLSVAPANDNFGTDAQFDYVITNGTATNDPVADSGWVTGAFQIPATVMTAGTTYYWTVTVRGTSGGSTTVKTETSPTWSFIASTAPTAAISCPAPYTDGSWQRDALTSPVTCTVTAPSAYTTAAKLSVALDGNITDTQSLSSQGSTSTSVTIPAGAAAHSITATTSIDATGASTDSTSDFGSGLWSNANYVPSITGGANSNDSAPVLYTNTDGAPFTSSVVLQYTVSANQDGSGVIAQSDWSAQPLAVPDGTLINGQTYYWHAEAKGKLNDGSGDADTISPTWSFVATADPTLSASTQASTTTQSSSVQASATSSCPSWLFIGVRGTNEPAGSGKSRGGYGWTSGGLGEMEQVAKKLKRDQNATIESLKYPASWAGVVGPAYWNSVAAGQANLVAEVNAVAKSCSSTKIWLGGHSQGAHVVENTIASGKFSRTAKINFRGAVLAGNPTYDNSDKIDAPGNGTDNGPLHAWHHNINYYTAVNNKGKRVTQARSRCFRNDIFCQKWGMSLPVHNSYKNEPTPTNEEKWLRQFA
ncbi:hypothetical protein GCM10009769_16220 [Curtobacterium luteum]|uniref:Cutinase n=1 Tax=Curtobacterium luteum TaxID=33881 RepID=A0A8H9KY36_9MICO|nr:hypothetical protein GCM10009769_16220 [Curtobacterium luteum]